MLDEQQQSEKSTLCEYDVPLERSADALAEMLQGDYRLSKRSIAFLLLQGDPDIPHWFVRTKPAGSRRLRALLMKPPEPKRTRWRRPSRFQRRDAARVITALAPPPRWKPAPPLLSGSAGSACLQSPEYRSWPLCSGSAFINSWEFSAGKTLVGLLEDGLFGKVLNPWMTQHVEQLLPWPWLSSLFCRRLRRLDPRRHVRGRADFPIVGTFFLAFSVL